MGVGEQHQESGLFALGETRTKEYREGARGAVKRPQNAGGTHALGSYRGGAIVQEGHSGRELGPEKQDG